MEAAAAAAAATEGAAAAAVAGVGRPGGSSLQPLLETELSIRNLL
jgi:hypothetical protein